MLGPLNNKTEEDAVFADALPERWRSAARISEIWYQSQHCLSLYSKVRIWLFATKSGLLVRMRLVLLLSTSMAGSLVMGSTLLQSCYRAHRFCTSVPTD